MNDLETMLSRVAHAPLPALDGIEAGVLARIAARPDASTRTGLGAMTVLVALGIGVVGAGVPTAPAVSPLAALGPVAALAPSTLLVGEP